MTLLPEYEVKKIMMADKVKEVAKQIGWDWEKDARGRKLLQQVGNIGRQYYIDTWVNQAISEIQKSHPDIAIIDDLRFPNEIDKLRKAFPDTYIIRLTRNTHDMNDISETAMDGLPLGVYDLIVENENLTIEETNADIDLWMFLALRILNTAAAWNYFYKLEKELASEVVE